MRKIVSILLIVAFFVQCTSQLWILAAFKINQDYIANNLCINRFESIPVCKGSCILENQLNKDQKQQQQIPDLKAKEISLFCQDYSSKLSFEAILYNTNIAFPSFKTSFITSAYLESVFHPPSYFV